MTIIESLRTYFQQYSGLSTGAPIWVNMLGPNPVEYAIQPLPGAGTIETDITGKRTKSYPFAFMSVESTADDLSRFETMGFYEALAEWVEQQDDANIYPVLDPGKKPIGITVSSWAYLFQEGISDTGIYQVQCQLTYEEE